MAGQGFESDAAAMTGAASGFDEAAERVRAAMSALDQQMTEALRAYQGQQATACFQLRTRIQTRMSAVSGIMARLSELVMTSKSGYEGADEDISQTFATLSGEVGDGVQSPVLQRIAGG